MLCLLDRSVERASQKPESSIRNVAISARGGRTIRITYLYVTAPAQMEHHNVPRYDIVWLDITIGGGGRGS